MNETDVFNALKYRTYDPDWEAYIWRNRDGKYHRLGGPAIEYANGGKVWYQNDQLHRTDGPAVEYDDGDKMWYQNDLCHRTDGPAAEHKRGYKEWYIDGKLLSEEEFNQRTKL